MRNSSLRRRLLGGVGALILLSLVGSGVSVFRIREVAQSIDRMNRVSVPMGRTLIQLGNDAESFRREAERRVLHPLENGRAFSPIPDWVEKTIDEQLSKISLWVDQDRELKQERQTEAWQKWSTDITQKFQDARARLKDLQNVKTPEKADIQSAAALLDSWARQVEWGVGEHERLLRARFSRADAMVSELRTGLEIILAVVVALSMILLWLSERALRPLAQLSNWVRRVADRGVTREDKLDFPHVSAGPHDEVGQLAHEFHQLTTGILEREKEIEETHSRLQEQNRLLSEMSELNWNVLASIESALIVINARGEVSQVNPAACQWLGLSAEKAMGKSFKQLDAVRVFDELTEVGGENFFQAALRLAPVKVGKKMLGGRCIPLRSRDQEAHPSGWILLVEDLTQDHEMQERLHQAESLAAVGRMSAQVAHEIRNPLHSIGLEAEVALDALPKESDPNVKVSLQSILRSVGRLQEITDQYLKLSRLSSGEKKPTQLSDMVESVLATYASACEDAKIQVDWRKVGAASPWLACDRSVFEPCLGNLLANAIEALRDQDRRSIRISYGLAESGRAWLRMEDNGPGLPASVSEQLFQPFVTSKAQGTGLGLSFVKKVIEDHGGTIEGWAEGHDPAYPGACFEIRVPALETSFVATEPEARLQ